MKKTIQLEGKSARAKLLIRAHGKKWKVKDREEDWFSPDGTDKDKTGLRVQSIGCNCPSCMAAHEQHWMWIFETDDREYKII